MAARRITRAAAITAAAFLLTSQPGLAQPQQEPGSVAIPPPVDMNRKLVDDTGAPPTNVTYTKKQVCINSLTDGKVELANKPWGQDTLRIDDAHQFATGKGQVVAVIDTGVREHEYLKGRVIKGPDYVSKSADSTEDCDGHGTEVAGIIAANPNSAQIGFTGVAPDAKIMAIRQSSEYYKGTREATAEDPNPQELPAG
ncbi:S8 family serine peptidase, partial [Kibdelosporangium lantanae]